MFLTMMGEHLYDFDAESELLAAFECFDEADSGFVKCDEIRKWLGDVGERMDEHEVSIDFLLAQGKGVGLFSCQKHIWRVTDCSCRLISS